VNKIFRGNKAINILPLAGQVEKLNEEMFWNFGKSFVMGDACHHSATAGRAKVPG
jgi:hypothetical protein